MLNIKWLYFQIRVFIFLGRISVCEDILFSDSIGYQKGKKYGKVNSVGHL